MNHEIVTYANGNTKYECYYHSDGEFHRNDDKPAVIMYYPDGKIHSVEFYVNGIYSRQNNNPHKIEYFKDGNERYTWYDHNENVIRTEIVVTNELVADDTENFVKVCRE